MRCSCSRFFMFCGLLKTTLPQRVGDARDSKTQWSIELKGMRSDRCKLIRSSVVLHSQKAGRQLFGCSEMISNSKQTKRVEWNQDVCKNYLSSKPFRVSILVIRVVRQQRTLVFF